MKSIYLIFMVIILFGCQTPMNSETCKECDSCDKYFDDRAMLDVTLNSWGEVDGSPTEIGFNFYVINYGGVEAKDVKVSCKVLTDDDTVILTLTEELGNVASKSTKLGETMKDNTNILVEGNFGFCYVESCSNCIILYKEVKELVEIYE